ncbi:MAG: DUF554 domain-containing protein [Peptoniphilaceae bacterium]
MIAVLTNAILIALGALLGNLAGDKILSPNLQKQITDILGIFVVFLGISTSLEGENVVLILMSCVIGVIIGNAINLEKKLYKLGERLKTKFFKNNQDSTSRLIEGFITASLIFSAGSMSILGVLTGKVSGDYSILFTKSILDGITSLILAASFGIGVLFSAFIVLVYEGILFLFATNLEFIFTPVMLANISGVGGILIMAIGINMMGIKRLKNENMIPAILIPIIYDLIINIF